MNQVIEAASKLEAATKAIDNMFSITVSIHYRDGATRVHLFSLRDLEQVPGEAVKFDTESEMFPVEYRKTVGSVEFFVWLKEDEV